MMTIQTLANEFIEIYVARRLKPTTANGYNTNLRLHIIPYIGRMKINDITYHELDVLVRMLSDKGLSNTTIVYTLATLRKMYAYAIRREYCKINPVANYDFPRKERFDYSVLTETQLKELLIGAKTSTDRIAYMLAGKYGLRRGEILGLHDYDIHDLCLFIHRTRSVVDKKETVTSPKSGKCRIIKLTGEDYDYIRKYDMTRRINEKGYLLRSDNGVELSPAMLDKRFRRTLADLGLPDVRFHDLRHTYATIMLSHGVNPKVVSSVLGHSDIGITLDLYSHYNVNMQDMCLSVWA